MQADLLLVAALRLREFDMDRAAVDALLCDKLDAGMVVE